MERDNPVCPIRDWDGHAPLEHSCCRKLAALEAENASLRSRQKYLLGTRVLDGPLLCMEGFPPTETITPETLEEVLRENASLRAWRERWEPVVEQARRMERQRQQCGNGKEFEAQARGVGRLVRTAEAGEVENEG